MGLGVRAGQEREHLIDPNHQPGPWEPGQWLRIQISQVSESPQRAKLWGAKTMQDITRRAALQGTAAVAAVARYARQRASGGASGAWIGQARERKGRSPVGESQAGLRFQYMGSQMGKASPKIFPQIQNPHFGRRARFSPPPQFLDVPCNAAITTIVQPHNMGIRI